MREGRGQRWLRIRELVLTGQIPSLDPKEACQAAIDAGLIVVRAHPLNCETSIPALIGGAVTPNARFYVRNHFQIPLLDPTTWRLTVGGLVERPLSLSLRELHRLPSHSLSVTLECAGNGRSTLRPSVEGEKWGLGAVSTAEWTGVRLSEVLDRAGIKAGVQEVLFRGADAGTVDTRPGTVRFERSLPLAEARDRDLLLAYAMNGEPLPVQHGSPLRLVVPSWYAVASVKWLTEIEAIDHPFEGAFQGDRYVFEREKDGQTRREPVNLQRVRAVITEPDPRVEVQRGELAIRGMAWSGAATIARVEVSIDEGAWQLTRLSGDPRPHTWRQWELFTRIDQPGHLSLRARATDSAGRSQPERADWNRFGYGNNAVQEISITIA
jgi:DMSO/TMAO reductase YedYZ molybdopterin-dependent catalytic subunit